MAFVNKDNFADIFDLGVPVNEAIKGMENVLLLHKDDSALPPEVTHEWQDGVKSGFSNHRMTSALDATENCDIMHVALTKSMVLHATHKKQCLAIVLQCTSHHAQNWLEAAAIGAFGTVVATGLTWN